MALCDEVLHVDSDQADAWYLKGIVSASLGSFTDSCQALEQAVDRAPARADWQAVLSGVKLELQDYAGAEAAARTSISLDASMPEPFINLALVLQHRLDFDAAVVACKQAFEIDPMFGHVSFVLGNIYLAQGKLDEAADCYRKTIEVEPGHAQALINLGNVSRERLDIAAAGAFYRQAAEADPAMAAAHANLGIVLKDQGRMAEALAAFERALELDPSTHLARSNLLFCLCFKIDANPEDILAAHITFDELHARPLLDGTPNHSNDPNPSRRLRIGLMSPDLRIHPGGHFYLPIVEGLDREDYEVFCYYNYIVRDEWTERFEGAADHFHHVLHWSDEKLAKQIEADRIDILLEGAGHMSGGRLLVAARKPAPVQIATALYPNTTGVAAIDYRLLDARVALPEADQWHTEEVIRLPETHFCYRPLERDISPAELMPAERNGFITFGSFNNAIKLNDLTVAAWSSVLRQLPNSRLILKWLELDQPGAIGILEKFAGEGISSDRILRYGWSPDPYTPYRDLDICLDPLLASGGTTTCDGLWMGVPVVTMAGDSVFSRTGLMHLTNIGLPELIAKTPEEYIGITVGLASDVEALKALRTGLRERMIASPIMDEPRYNRFLDQELRRVWRHWCQSQSTLTVDSRR